VILARISNVLQRFAPRGITWEGPATGRQVYLTFDDGPTPEVTEWVLDRLDVVGAKATFFCLGSNVDKHPELYQEILQRGHATGNHSHTHKKGFRTSVKHYLADIDRAGGLIDSRLFRPPYGRILPWQVRRIRQRYTIVMWSVLSVDYDPCVSGRQVVKNVLDNVRPGSVIVFHDSVKASKNLYHALPEVLAFLHREGFGMVALNGSSPRW